MERDVRYFRKGLFVHFIGFLFFNGAHFLTNVALQMPQCYGEKNQIMVFVFKNLGLFGGYLFGITLLTVAVFGMSLLTIRDYKKNGDGRIFKVFYATSFIMMFMMFFTFWNDFTVLWMNDFACPFSPV